MFKNLWNKLPIIIVCIAISLRLYGVFSVPAQSYDMSTYRAWGNIMIDKGPREFFASTWSDYLPLPIYVCSLLTVVADALHVDFGLLFKLVITLIECSLILLIRKPLALLLLSPALMGDSAYWGQLDTIPALLVTLSLLRLEKSVLTSAVIFGIAVAFKPIILIILPVFLITLFLKYKRNLAQSIKFSLVSFITFLLPAIPVGGVRGAFTFVWNKAVEQASTYPYTTINGWNLWSIRDLHNMWPPDSYSIFGITAHTAGFILFGILALSTLNAWRKHNFAPAYMYRVAGTLLVIFYTCTTRMHERHLLFGLPLLTIAAMTQKWLTIPTAILTTTFTLNLWAAYWWVNHGQSWPVSPVTISLLSWLNVGVAVLLATVWDWPRAVKEGIVKLKSHKYLAAIILLAAVLRLTYLSYPSTYIFDEVYHSFTAKEYMRNNVEAWEWWTTPPPGVAYEWTHPPLAKYGMVIGMLLFGENAYGWRVGSAVMGVFIIFGIYRLARALHLDRSVALTAAFLVSIEGLHLVQSRVGMNDTYTLAFLVWSFYYALRGSWKVSAVLYGLALSSKWSALYGIVPLAVIYLSTHKLQWNVRNIGSHLVSIVRLLLISVIVYILTFIPFFSAGHTAAQWWELHRQMWYYHTHLDATHGYQSTPKEWVLSLRPVWYYVDYADKTANIYAQGNPLVLWLGLTAALASVLRILRHPYTLLFTLYGVFTIPWLFSPRIMFFYHYLPSATFLSLLTAAWLHELPRGVKVGLLILCGIVFVIMSPMYFGIPMPGNYWNTIFALFPSWK